MNIPWMKSGDAISVMIDGQMHTVPLDSHIVAELVDLLNSDTDDLDRLKALVDPTVSRSTLFDGSTVVIGKNSVTVKGKPVAKALADRIIDIDKWGLPTTSWAIFAERLMSNPLASARDELILFMEVNNLPITDDGCILAYKRVADNFTDIRTRTFDNSVGQVVQMARSAVDADRASTCSTGLHFCAQSYLPSYGGAKTVLVKIDPADIVSIPNDYNNAKGRTWRYEVVAVVPNGSASKPTFTYEKPVVTGLAPVEVAADFDDEPPLASVDVPSVTGKNPDASPIAFVAPGDVRVNIWKRIVGTTPKRKPGTKSKR